MVPGAKRGLYLTKSKPPVLKSKPKPIKAVPVRKPSAQERIDMPLTSSGYVYEKQPTHP